MNWIDFGCGFFCGILAGVGLCFTAYAVLAGIF